MCGKLSVFKIRRGEGIAEVGCDGLPSGVSNVPALSRHKDGSRWKVVWRIPYAEIVGERLQVYLFGDLDGHRGTDRIFEGTWLGRLGIWHLPGNLGRKCTFS